MSRDTQNHPVEQPIRCIQTVVHEEGVDPYYVVGQGGVTRIEACVKFGEYAAIPYVRVWKGDLAIYEVSQHTLTGLWFAEEKLPPQDDEQPF